MINEENLTILRYFTRLEFPEIPDVFFENMRFTVKSQIDRDGKFTTDLQFVGSASYGNEEAILDAITMLPGCYISPDADYTVSRYKKADFGGEECALRFFFYVAMPEEDVKFLMDMGNLVEEDREREVSYGVVCDL